VLIRIADDAPAERLEIRWQAALRICEPLLSGRPWRVVSLAPGLEQGGGVRGGARRRRGLAGAVGLLRALE
jgi:hypothetical protein